MGNTMVYEDLAKGEGRVVPEKRLALYRDDGGTLHSFDCYCTHEHCLLKWNSPDKTWDCHCHNSKFTADGHVIQGPAIEPMSTKDPS